MQRRVIFRNKGLPYLLLLPQLVITAAFFFWPAGQAIYQSMLLQDPFGLNSRFVWLENFTIVLSNPLYLNAVANTVVFSLSVTLLSMSAALAPAVAALLWLFVFHPSVGIIGRALRKAGVPWDYKLNGDQAMGLIIFAAAWKQVSYNFLFFLAGLQAIPRSVIEAASIDGAGPSRRFWTIIFPLLSPTSFFLLVVNIVYAFFDTFGIIHALTAGGPGKSTETLIYKVYVDGVVNLDLGGSAAESVILMIVVIGLTAIQFRYVERRVQY